MAGPSRMIGICAVAAVAAITLTAAGGASERREGTTTCTYDPATKVVDFAFTADADPQTFDLFQPYLVRDGDKLVFKADYDSPLSCAGGVPTVHNTDTIELTASGASVAVILDLPLNKGPLAPGATPEPSGSEIEIDSTIPDIEIDITPAETTEHFSFGQTADGAAANLNSDSDSDADIVLHDLKAPRQHDDFVFAVAEYTNGTNRGADVYSAAGGKGFSGPFPYNVLLVGGTGRDRLTGGLGNDTLYGGEDRDALFGGEGNDRLNALGAQTDLVDCGPGNDLAQATQRDKIKHCERIARSN